MTVASHCSGKYMAPNYYSIKHIWPLNIIQYIMWAWITIRGKFVLCHSLSTPCCQSVQTRHFKERNPSLDILTYRFSSTNVQSVKVGVAIQWVPVTLIHWLKISVAARSNIPRLRLSVHVLNKWLRFKKAMLGLHIGRWFTVFSFCIYSFSSSPILWRTHGSVTDIYCNTEENFFALFISQSNSLSNTNPQKIQI